MSRLDALDLVVVKMTPGNVAARTAGLAVVAALHGPLTWQTLLAFAAVLYLLDIGGARLRRSWSNIARPPHVSP